MTLRKEMGLCQTKALKQSLCLSHKSRISIP